MIPFINVQNFKKNVEIKYFSKIFESIELMKNKTNEWIDLRKSSF